MLLRYGTIYPLLPALLALVVITSGCGEPVVPDPSPPDPTSVHEDPAWGPDGNHIAYVRDARITEDTTDVTGLYIRDLETDSTWLVTEGLMSSPDWRPDGERIAFSAGDIFTIRPDGSSLRRVTEFGSSFDPKWSPEGQTLTFGRSGSTEEVGVWFAHLRDSSFVRFGWVASPADWSPEGTRIVYQNNDQLWIADTSRTDSTQLTDNNAMNNDQPAWSPNGKWITWQIVTNDASELWVMRADGSEKQYVINTPGRPSWGPDSERIALTKESRKSDYRAIWTIRRDGSDLRQITTPSRNPLN